MKRIRFLISELAASDILEQADWYRAQSGAPLAKRWEKAITSSILRIVRSPKAGTPCYFSSSALQTVRRTTINGFPKHLIFYRFIEDELFILRVVHGARDLELLL